MIIKRRSILVIVLSSILISLVLVITLAGFYLSLNWKEENNKNIYLDAIHELNAKLYAKYISIISVTIKIADQKPFENRPIIEGQIKNRSNKKITSLKLKISLLDQAGKVLYMDVFYPIQGRSYFIYEETGTYLAPNDSVSFKHILRNCPKHIYTYLKMKRHFAKEKRKDIFNINHKIEELVLE